MAAVTRTGFAQVLQQYTAIRSCMQAFEFPAAEKDDELPRMI